MELKQAQFDLAKQRKTLTDKTKEFKTAIEKRNVELANEIKAEIGSVQDKINELEEKVIELEETQEQEVKEEASANEVEDKLSGNSVESDNRDYKGEDEVVEKRQVLTEEVNQEVRAFENYITKRTIEEGVKSDGGQVVIPEDIKNEIIDLVEDKFKLKNLVTVEQVSNASGKRKVRTNTDTRLSTVAELNENPQIAVTKLDDVNYEVETKRGYVPIAQEAIDDGVMTVQQIKSYIGEVAINTENHDIMSVLGTITGKEVSTADEIKDIINVEFPVSVSKSVQFLVPQSVYNAIDKLKNDKGEYLLQPSISSPSGYMLFGKDVIVLDDFMFPTKQTAFVGNLKEIVYFDRADLRVEWTNYMHYGQCLSPILRNDVKKSREDLNIKKFILKPEEETP